MKGVVFVLISAGAWVFLIFFDCLFGDFCLFAFNLISNG